MNRVMTWTAALTVLVAGFAVVGQSQAEAGLFNRNKCSKQAKKCRTPRRSRNKCSQTASCAPQSACAPAPCAPTPCAAAPCATVVEAAPACGGCVQLASCNTGCSSRRQQRKAHRHSGCVQASACGTSSCGAPTQGCSSCGSASSAPVEGCSSCSSAGSESSAPAPAAPEAAPEAPKAPESDATT